MMTVGSSWRRAAIRLASPIGLASSTRPASASANRQRCLHPGPQRAVLRAHQLERLRHDAHRLVTGQPRHLHGEVETHGGLHRLLDQPSFARRPEGLLEHLHRLLVVALAAQCRPEFELEIDRLGRVAGAQRQRRFEVGDRLVVGHRSHRLRGRTPGVVARPSPAPRRTPPR